MSVFARIATACLVLLLVCQGHSPASAAVAGRPDRDKIVFAWTQGGDLNGVHWHALTHVGYTFVSFDDTATLSGLTSFNSRSAELKPGGAAANCGVKVVMALMNAGFDETILDTVMQSATLRQTLISRVVAAVSDPVNGCDGVNLDFELIWGTATRDGMMTFITDLNTALKSLSPPRELSIYTLSSWSGTQYSASTLASHVDYVLPSGYDYATGSTMTSVGRYSGMVNGIDSYIAAGVPASHIVIALPFYTASWTTTATGQYGGTGAEYGADSWTNANFETTFLSSPYAKYDSVPASHITKWYRKLISGTTYRLVTFDDAETLEAKMRMAKTFTGDNSTGRELGGIAYWSIMWATETSSVDPNSQATGSQSLTRTSSPPYSLMEELFSPPGTTTFVAEPFESLSVNPRWVDPDDGPDDDATAANSAAPAMIACPAGAYNTNSKRAISYALTFPSAGGRLFLKYQPLMGTTSPYRVDWNGMLLLTDKNTNLIADVYVPAAYSTLSVRMVVRDGNGQLEKGPATTFPSAGWRRIQWNVSSAAAGNVTAYTTAEGAYISGNGVIDSAGGGVRDIAFAGFEVTSTGTASPTIDIDQILYQRVAPNDARYLVNEFRYATASQQFVEIKGPAGSVFPSGLVMRSFDGATGDVVSTVALGGNTIPASGLYLLGTANIPGRNQTFVADTISSTTPAAIDIYDSGSGFIHDSVVYKGFTGAGMLSSPFNPIVTDNGPGYFGDICNGANSAGAHYTAGRFPDGASTGVNEADFSFMPATPGAPNCRPLILPAVYDFSTAPPDAFETFKSFAVTPAASIPTQVGQSAPGAGSVHRCVDATGGGSESVFGDVSLIAPIKVTGRVFVPANGTSADAHATGLGICGRSGGYFFGSTAAAGFDSGYWLLYENASGVGLADGRSDHPGVFEFVWANNDGIASPAILLGTLSLASTGASAGAWTNFELTIDPTAAAGSRLIAKINTGEVYRGDIPSGGPTAGAFMVGYRENHTGVPLAYEGTWVDSITIQRPNLTAASDWQLYR